MKCRRCPVRARDIFFPHVICVQVTVDKFHLVQDSLRQLSTFLTYQDRTLVEAACDCYSHLVVNLSSSSELVGQLTQHSLLPNLLCLITTTPPIIGRSSISVVVKILSTVLKTCPDLATMLHGEDVGATIRQMLVNVAGGAGSSNADASKRGDLSVGGTYGNVFRIYGKLNVGQNIFCTLVLVLHQVFT